MLTVLGYCDITDVDNTQRRTLQGAFKTIGNALLQAPLYMKSFSETYVILSRVGLELGVPTVRFKNHETIYIENAELISLLYNVDYLSLRINPAVYDVKLAVDALAQDCITFCAG